MAIETGIRPTNLPPLSKEEINFLTQVLQIDAPEFLLGQRKLNLGDFAEKLRETIIPVGFTTQFVVQKVNENGAFSQLVTLDGFVVSAITSTAAIAGTTLKVGTSPGADDILKEVIIQSTGRADIVSFLFLGTGTLHFTSNGVVSVDVFLLQAEAGSLLDDTSILGFWEKFGDDIKNSNIGAVGIGTGTPSAKLHVFGDAKISSTLEITGKTLKSNTVDQVLLPTISSAILDFSDKRVIEVDMVGVPQGVGSFDVSLTNIVRGDRIKFINKAGYSTGTNVRTINFIGATDITTGKDNNVFGGDFDYVIDIVDSQVTVRGLFEEQLQLDFTANTTTVIDFDTLRGKQLNVNINYGTQSFNASMSARFLNAPIEATDSRLVQSLGKNLLNVLIQSDSAILSSEWKLSGTADNYLKMSYPVTSSKWADEANNITYTQVFSYPSGSVQAKYSRSGIFVTTIFLSTHVAQISNSSLPFLPVMNIKTGDQTMGGGTTTTGRISIFSDGRMIFGAIVSTNQDYTCTYITKS